jgi:phospholipase C
MLFVISFDEHGGTYDHVAPTTTVAPDSHTGNLGFDFTRLGVRVPTILVSRYVHAGTVFRSPDADCDLDHTSFIATMLKWAGIEPSSAGLGARVAVAPTFEDAVSETPRSAPLPTFTVPDGYETQGDGTGALHLGPLGTLVPSPLNWKKIRDLSELIEGVEGIKDFLNHLGKHAKEQAEVKAGADTDAE